MSLFGAFSVFAEKLIDVGKDAVCLILIALAAGMLWLLVKIVGKEPK